MMEIKDAYKMDTAVTGAIHSEKLAVDEDQRKKELEKLKNWKQQGADK